MHTSGWANGLLVFRTGVFIIKQFQRRKGKIIILQSFHRVFDVYIYKQCVLKVPDRTICEVTNNFNFKFWLLDSRWSRSTANNINLTYFIEKFKNKYGIPV